MTSPFDSYKVGIHFTQVTPTCSVGAWKTILERSWNLNLGFFLKRLAWSI